MRYEGIKQGDDPGHDFENIRLECVGFFYRGGIEAVDDTGAGFLTREDGGERV